MSDTNLLRGDRVTPAEAGRRLNDQAARIVARHRCNEPAAMHDANLRVHGACPCGATSPEFDAYHEQQAAEQYEEAFQAWYADALDDGEEFVNELDAREQYSEHIEGAHT